MTQAASDPGTDQPDLARRIWRRYLAARRDRRIKGFLTAASTLASSRPLMGQTNAAVFVCPWPIWQQFPDYMIFIALAMRYRGIHTTLIWDDIAFDRSTTEQKESDRISTLLTHIQPALPVVRASDHLAQDCTLFTHDRALAEYARLHTLRHYKTDSPPPTSAAYEAGVRSSLVRITTALHSALQTLRPSYVVAGGGLYRTSCAMVHAAKTASVRTATLDSGTGIVTVATNGIAAYLDDMPRTYRSLEHMPFDWDVEVANAEFARRLRCSDRFSIQAVPAGALHSTTTPNCVLIALNQGFDASALGRHCVFHHQSDWMMRSVQWILANSEAAVVVRRHPVERRRNMRSNDEYGALLAPWAARYPDRLTYIDEHAPISTYDIMHDARLVLVHTSSLAMEATMRGIPVVTQTRSSFADAGFVWHADSDALYFKYLHEGLRGQLVVSDLQRARASRFYCLTQCCNFFPLPEWPGQLPTWNHSSARPALGSHALDLVIESIHSGVPLAHTRYMQLRSSAAHS